MELKHTAQRPGRLSSFLREEMAMSLGLMNRLKWQDKLFVNGTPRHTDYAVQSGDTITVQLDEPKPEFPAEDGPLTVLYEDAHILAVDKPAGMLIHPSRSRLTGTLANRVFAYYEKTGQSCAFHPLTRLDRDTFGVVLLAKNSHIHALISAQGFEKEYRALVFGGPKTDSGIIDAPIARLPLPSLLRHVSPDGKPSVTEFKVLERHENSSLLSLKPITGRTHQLRVHCAYKGFPILGDPQYGNEACKNAFDHQQLLAYGLHLTHPVTKQELHIFTKFTLGGNNSDL